MQYPVKDISLDVNSKLHDNEDIVDPIDEVEIEDLKITNPSAYEEIMENTHA
jgi:hypothetical protein